VLNAGGPDAFANHNSLVTHFIGDERRHLGLERWQHVLGQLDDVDLETLAA